MIEEYKYPIITDKQSVFDNQKLFIDRINFIVIESLNYQNSFPKDLCTIITDYAKNRLNDVLLSNFDAFWIKNRNGIRCVSCNTECVVFKHFPNSNGIDSMCEKGHVELSFCVGNNIVYYCYELWGNKCKGAIQAFVNQSFDGLTTKEKEEIQNYINKMDEMWKTTYSSANTRNIGPFTFDRF